MIPLAGIYFSDYQIPNLIKSSRPGIYLITFPNNNIFTKYVLNHDIGCK